MPEYQLSKRRRQRLESWLQRTVWGAPALHSLALKGLTKRAGSRESEEGLETWTVEQLEGMQVEDVIEACEDNAEQYPRQLLRMMPADENGAAITTRQRPHTVHFEQLLEGVNPDSRGSDAASEALSAGAARILGTAATAAERSGVRADAMALQVSELAQSNAEERLTAVLEAHADRTEAQIASAKLEIENQILSGQVDAAEQLIDELNLTVDDLQAELDEAGKRIAELEQAPNLWEEALRPVMPQLVAAAVPMVNALAMRAAGALTSPPAPPPAPAAVAEPPPAPPG